MKISVGEKDVGLRVDNFLVKYFENKYARGKIVDFIEKNEENKIDKAKKEIKGLSEAQNSRLLINKKVQKTSYKLKINDEIEFDFEGFEKFLNPDMTLIPYEFKLDIIYEDDSLLVINKPKNMLTHPTKFDREKTLVNALLNYCPDTLSKGFCGVSDSDDKSSADSILVSQRPGIIHRLDKNTSGLIMVAKTDEAQEKLAFEIKEKIAKRKYLALALGNFDEKEGAIDKPLVHYLKDNVKMTIAQEGEGLSAYTQYKVVEEFKGASLVELELKTGRTHQIRAHLASINHPVFGDSLYGAKSFMINEFYNLKTQEQLLQSYYLSFIHPKTDKRMEFQLKEEQFSKDFIKVLNFLRRTNKV